VPPSPQTTQLPVVGSSTPEMDAQPVSVVLHPPVTHITTTAFLSSIPTDTPSPTPTPSPTNSHQQGGSLQSCYCLPSVLPAIPSLNDSRSGSSPVLRPALSLLALLSASVLSSALL
jgi:hypothetical protein